MSICDPRWAKPLCDQAELYEAIDSRGARLGPVSGSREENQYTLRVFVWGTMDECTVRARLEDPAVGLPTEFHGLPFQEYTVDNIGWNVWEAVATYAWFGAARIGSQPLPQSISLSTSGGRVKLTQSWWTVDKYPPTFTGDDAEAPDFNRAIEWDGKTVNGVDVITSAPRYTETWLFPRGYLFEPVTAKEVYPGVGGQRYDATYTRVVDVPYRSRMELYTKYTGAVHGVPFDIYLRREETGPDAVWDKYPATYKQDFRNWGVYEKFPDDPQNVVPGQGNVLLAGVQVSQVSVDMFEVTFEFMLNMDNDLFIPNTVGNVANNTPIVKAGWDYLWFYYGKNKSAVKKDADPGNNYNVTASVPKYAYVEQIYPRVDFNWLGIGMAPLDTTPQGETVACEDGPQDFMQQWADNCS